MPESRVRGYTPGRFSFNVKGGRCENCKGDGILKIEMQFLPDVYVPCEVCNGKRYNREALEIHYKGKSIADVLEMTIAEALEFFSAVPNIRTKLQTLYDVGLGYVHLGQPATTLSGGEAQRVKLSTELSRRATGRTLYVLDEPTTGLHFADVEKLLEVLHRLVDGGNTVLVIEHNLDVIKTADWIVDLGPEGGDRGGRIIAEGTPETVAATQGSATGEYLARVLRGEPLVPLSDVTFAEEAGRATPDRTATATGPAGEGIAPSAQARGRRAGPAEPLRRGVPSRMPDIDFAFLADAAETIPGQKFHVLGGGIARIGGRRSRCATRIWRWSSACRSPRRRPNASTRSGSSCSIPMAPRWPARPAASWPAASATARDATLTFSIDLWNLTFPAPGDYSFRILVNGSERKRLPLLLLRPPAGSDGRRRRHGDPPVG